MLRGGKALLVLGLLLLLQLTVDPNHYVSRVLLLSCFSVMLAVSLNIINGYAGQFSIGHAGFYAVGAYTGASLSHFGREWMEASLGLASFPAWLADSAVLLAAVVAGSVAAAVAGFIVGLPSLRLRGDYLAIATLGFGELIRVIFINIDRVGGARGFSIAPINSIFWIGLFTVGIVWLSRNLLNSRQGRALQALRDDETAASVLGINITSYKVMAFVLSAAMAGCAGALYAHFDGYLQPDSFNFIRSIEIIIMVVLGGLGSTTGAVIAAVVLTVLPETLREFADYRMVIYSALLVICMLVRPQGLLGTSEFSWASLRSRGKETGGGLA
jgi:branched-chain amino acid transport system permease protein